jgi:rhomboid protease GluP
MTDPATAPLEEILRLCAAAAPHPWYPRAFADSKGIARDLLDPYLDRLRLRGLIRLTDWVAGNGQGYALTPAGERVLQTPRLLAQLRTGNVPDGHDEPAERSVSPDRMTTYERGEKVREALVSAFDPADRSIPLVTKLLLAANILVFLYGLYLANQAGTMQEYLMGGDIATVHRIGGIHATDLLRVKWWQADWWRLLSCCFVHFGLLHLGVNMYSLYAIGPLIERVWGTWRYLIIYLFAGFGGSCAMVVFTPGPVGAGASGALWGLLAAFAGWVLLNRRYLPPAFTSSMLRQLVAVFLLNIFITFAVARISKSAHFGGGLIGLLTAALLNYERFAHGVSRWLLRLAVLAIPLLCFGVLLRTITIDPRWQTAFAQAQLLEARRELQELQDEVLPRVEPLQSAAVDVYDKQVLPLLGQDWQQRNPATVAAAQQALEQSKAKLTEADQTLTQAGPYDTPRVEALLQARKEYNTELVQLLQMAGRALHEGEKWTAQDDAELNKQTDRVKKARNRFQALLRP